MENKTTKKSFNYNYLSSIFIYIWAVVFLIAANKIKDPASRMFPIAVSVLAIVMATLILLKNRFNWGKKEEPISFSGTSMAIIMFFLLLAYVIAIESMGFYAVTPFYLYISMWVLGQRKKKLMIAISLLTPIGVFLFFDLLLGMEIPGGLLLSKLLG